MRYRTKITLALALLVSVTGAMVLGLYYFQSRAVLFRQIQSQVLSIAATGALQVDGDLLSQIESSEDESLTSYLEIQSVLRRIRDANRREDTEVRFVYTMRPGLESPGSWIYIVDAEENSASQSHVGDPVEFEGDAIQPLTMEKPYAEPSFSHDEFGVWLSANAPILDSQGRAVGLLGVDIAASDVVTRMERLLWRGAGAMGIAVVAAIFLAAAVANWANAPLEKIRSALERIAKCDWDTRVHLKTHDEFGTVAEAVNNMAVALRDREMLKGALARYVSRDVAESILAKNELPALRGERRQITVLIADIRNFTAMSDQLPPEEIVRFLNVFFKAMIEAIFVHRGTLDKFLGDGLLAVFGAPLDDAEHQKMAVLAAIEMLKQTRELRQEMQSRHSVNLRIGIGIHTGAAVVGNIGSEERMEYTAIGDAVNITSRIEELNKAYNTELLVSRAVVEAVGSEFNFREVDSMLLRGLNDLITLYTIDREDAKPIPSESS